MKNGRILVTVSASTTPAGLEALIQSAASLRARLALLVVGALPPTPVFADGLVEYGARPIRDDWRERAEGVREALAKTAKTLEAHLAEQGVEGDAGVLCCDPYALPTAIARLAMASDGVVVSDDLRADDELFRGVVHGALFQSPVGVVLNGAKAERALTPRRVFAAWNGELPAARALHAALPLLAAADEVVVAMFDPTTTGDRDGENPGSDVAHWLSHHGCKATIRRLHETRSEVGDAIVTNARESGAELIVMGAYGRSRLREAVFGGTTRTIIEHKSSAVLLAH